MFTSTAHRLHDRDNRATAQPTIDAAAPVELSVKRLNAMRVGYAFVAIGLAIVKWPIVMRAHSLPAMEAVVVCMLTAMSVLMLLGVRYPVRLLPILLFEAAWKLTWFAAVGLPRAVTDDVSPRIGSLMINCSLVVVVLAVIPWSYVWTHYVKAPGERWR